MRYLVVYPSGAPFLTTWMSTEMFAKGCTVFDLAKDRYTKDGKNWTNIIQDHL